MCAAPSLSGPAVIAYADTLIQTKFFIGQSRQTFIWTKQVQNPEAYGVVNLNEREEIVELVEKPKSFVSNKL